MNYETFAGAIMTVRLRGDLPRAEAFRYWRTDHADTVRNALQLGEYRQHHFVSSGENVSGPGTTGVSTDPPLDWPLDGFAEVDFGSVHDMAKSAVKIRSVLLDEQNVFDLVVSHVHTRNGGRKWSPPVTDSESEKASFAVLIRRRRGVMNRPFTAFVHDQLGNALVNSGAGDVRTRTFIPRVLDTYVSPGVAHREPPNRRIDAVVTYTKIGRAHV